MQNGSEQIGFVKYLNVQQVMGVYSQFDSRIIIVSLGLLYLRSFTFILNRTCTYFRLMFRSLGVTRVTTAARVAPLTG